MASLIVLVAFLLGSVSATQACMCMPVHPQHHFCRADFVVRAQIINETDGPLASGSPEYMRRYPPVVYTIRIEKIFKGEDAIKKSKGVEVYGPKSMITARLHTPTKAISCEVPLQTRGVYLLTGTITDGHLRAGFCDWHSAWYRVTASQRAGIRHNYSPNCHCQVGPCYGSHCDEKLKGCGEIEWYPRLKEPCKRWYSFCKAVTDTACQWVQTAQYSRCWEDTP